MSNPKTTKELRDLADKSCPRGCHCSATDGGGDCEWCLVYYGVLAPKEDDSNE